jgi:hypothetical protein
VATAYAFVAPWQPAAVPASGVADYCTLAELRRSLYATIPPSDDSLDDVLAVAITDASRTVDALCNVPEGTFVARSLTRMFDVSPYRVGTTIYVNDWGDVWQGTAYVTIPPLLAAYAVATDADGDGVFEVPWTEGTDYVLDPSDGPPYRRVALREPTARYGFPSGQRRVQISGSWGASATVPPPIRRATILLATRYWKRPEAPFGIVGSIETGVATIRVTDPDVWLILKEGGYMTDTSRWVIA